VLVAEEADRAVAVFIDAKPADRVLVAVADQVSCGGEHRGHQPPRHPVRAGHLGRGPAGDHHRVDQGSTQAGGGPGERRHLVGDLAERRARAPGPGRRTSGA
jgi:hypothetical protein